MNSKKKSTVYDKHNNAYELTKRVGEGGQGIVCQTQIDGILVKILNTKESEKYRINFMKYFNFILKRTILHSRT